MFKLFTDLHKYRKILFQMGKNDFKNKFSSTSMGAIWGFIQPIVFMFMYLFVFEYVLRSGNTGNYPFIVWFVPGIALWMFLNDGTMMGCLSIRSYSYLVKKIVFPVGTIPFISLTSSMIVSTIVIGIATFIDLLFGVAPNILIMLYIYFSSLCFLIAITRITSAAGTMMPDFVKMIEIILQLLFWLTPVVWDKGMLPASIGKFILLNPYAYLVTGFREAYVGGHDVIGGRPLYTIVFWVITILLYVYGDYIFKKSQKEFADVL